MGRLMLLTVMSSADSTSCFSSLWSAEMCVVPSYDTYG